MERNYINQFLLSEEAKNFLYGKKFKDFIEIEDIKSRSLSEEERILEKRINSLEEKKEAANQSEGFFVNYDLVEEELLLNRFSSKVIFLAEAIKEEITKGEDKKKRKSGDNSLNTFFENLKNSSRNYFSSSRISEKTVDLAFNSTLTAVILFFLNSLASLIKIIIKKLFRLFGLLTVKSRKEDMIFKKES